MIDQRKAEITALITALSGSWPLLQNELKARRENLVERLIMSENAEVRGRIKELTDLIDLPAALLQELRAFPE